MKIIEKLSKLFSSSPKEEVDINSDGLSRPTDESQPWCAVIGQGIVDGQLKLELDWNEAFIEFLLSNGFTGTSDEDIVSKWMLMVHKELSETTKEEV